MVASYTGGPYAGELYLIALYTTRLYIDELHIVGLETVAPNTAGLHTGGLYSAALSTAALYTGGDMPLQHWTPQDCAQGLVGMPLHAVPNPASYSPPLQCTIRQGTVPQCTVLQSTVPLCKVLRCTIPSRHCLRTWGGSFRALASRDRPTRSHQQKIS